MGATGYDHGRRPRGRDSLRAYEDRERGGAIRNGSNQV